MKTYSLIFHEYKIDIPTGRNKRILIAYANILYIICNKPYCNIRCFEGKKYLIEATLHEFETQLPEIFFRCNSSAIVNLSRIKAYSASKPVILNMEDEYEIPVSYRKTPVFLERINAVPRLTAPFEQCSLCNSAPACCEMYRAKRVEKI